jgi:mannose-6-phosphate isomerase
MFVEIDNTPRDYAWGSTHAIAELLGRPASGRPEAELWFGAHPLCPSIIVNPADVDGAKNLAELLDRDAQTLPFLLKVLAAETALSIQVHPSMAQALTGFAAENAAGIPLDAPHRNYRDASHKPELIFCVSETFDALCGFRSVATTVASLRAFVDEASRAGLPSDALVELIAQLEASDSDVRQTVAGMLSGDRGEVSDLVNQLLAIAQRADATSPIDRDASTVRMLGVEYPGDPGIVVAFLMNRVSLRAGEAMYVPHGILHAYLSGLGIEIMAASDNVLRGGLTSKHVDVAELMSVGVFSPTTPSLVTPDLLSAGVHRFAPGVREFELVHVVVTEGAEAAEVQLDGASIVLCTAGQAQVAGSHASAEIRRGQAWFVSADEPELSISGSAELFVARTGR